VVEKLTFVLITAAGLMGGGGKHGHGSSGGHGGVGGGGAAGTAINLAKSALASGAMGKKGMMASAVLGGGGGSHGGGGHGGGGSAGGLFVMYNNDKYLSTVLWIHGSGRIHLFLGLPDPHPDPIVRDTDRIPLSSGKKIVIKTFIPIVLWLLYDFLSFLK
jgi:hypothetical protein